MLWIAHPSLLGVYFYSLKAVYAKHLWCSAVMGACLGLIWYRPECLRLNPPRSSPQPKTDGELVDKYPLLEITLKHMLHMDSIESILSPKVTKQALIPVALNGNWLDICLLSAFFPSWIYSLLSFVFPGITSQINYEYLNACFRISFRRKLKPWESYSLKITSETTNILCLH